VLHDDPDTQLALMNALEDAGHDTIVGGPGRSGLVDVEFWPFDVLVTDVLKYGLSAWYLIRRARRARPEAAIIAICPAEGRLPRETMAHLTRLHGADAILTHPVACDALWQTVASLVDKVRPAAA
jgi:CheY-like chemotaxis protein